MNMSTIGARVALTVFIGLLAPAVHAAPGVLDLSLGGTGVVTTNLNANYVSWSDLVQTPDGIFVGGSSSPSAGSANGLISSYKLSGGLNSAFNGNGIVSISDLSVYGLSIQDLQGVRKLVAIGNHATDHFQPPVTYTSTVVRYNLDGTIDNTFGQGGKAILQQLFPQMNMIVAHSLLTTADGKIIVGAASPSKGILIQLNAEGTPDTNFGTNGSAVAGDSNGPGISFKPIPLPSGKILVAGQTVGSNPRPALYRFNADGSIDSTFQNGIRSDPVFQQFWNIGFFIDGVALQAMGGEGKIVVAGKVYCGLNNVEKDCAAMARFNADGSLDPSFGTDGLWLSQDFGHARDIAVQGDGKIILATDGYYGSRYCGAKGCSGILRLLPDGNGLDANFAAGGLVVTPQDNINGVGRISALQTDALGRILTVGYSYVQDGPPQIFLGVLARHLGDAPSPCGNGTPDAGEACDDGNPTNGDGCDANCAQTGCGNGVLTTGEACDDGNTANGDSCSSVCQAETPPPKSQCPASCDDGDACTIDSCGPSSNYTCKHDSIPNCPQPAAPSCGDGIVQAGEQCEPPNHKINLLTYCTSTCQNKTTFFSFPVCGNGKVEKGEGCDDGNKDNTDGCNTDCQRVLIKRPFPSKLYERGP